MNLKQLCYLLKMRMSNKAEQEVSILQDNLSALMLHIGTSIPGQLPFMQEFHRVSNNELMQARINRVSVDTYFSGHGPIADMLRNYCDMSSFFYPEENEKNKQSEDFKAWVNNYEMQTPKQDNEAVRQFDFHPEQGETNQELNNFIATLQTEVINDLYLTPIPQALPPTNQVDLHLLMTVRTGIYNAESGPENTTLVLRAEVPNQRGLEVLLFAKHNEPPSLLYWHPFELHWINSNWTSTFEGVLETLQGQLRVAVEAAQPMEQDFVFAEELDRLESQAAALFDMESKLPPTLFFYKERGLSATRLPNHEAQSTYSRSPVESRITINVNEMRLIFMCTKGAYPNRSRFIMKYNGEKVSHTVPNESIKRPDQEVLIQKAALTLSVIHNVVCV
jgi:hypothetical protein